MQIGPFPVSGVDSPSTFAMIGNGGKMSFGRSFQGNLSGSITVKTVNDLVLDPRGSFSTGETRIGHGGLVNTTADEGNSPFMLSALGTQSGDIQVDVGRDLVMEGGFNTGYSQIGHGGGIHAAGTIGAASGRIDVTVVRDALLEGTTNTTGGSFREAQIGHGGYVFGTFIGGASRAAIAADPLTLTVGRELRLLAGAAQQAYTQVGHGGFLWTQPQGAVVTSAALAGAAGDLIVQASSIEVRGGSGAVAYSQIGNGGQFLITSSNGSTASLGPVSGAVQVTTTGATCPSPPTSLACGDLVLASGGVVDNESYAHVGHGGEPVDAGAGVFGTEVSAAGGITLEVAGEISLVDGLDPVVDFWWIGHLMTIPATISGAEVSLDTATLDFDDATSSPSATVDDDQFWPRFVGDGGASGEADNVSGGAVILRVRGGAGDDGNLVSQRSLTVPGGTTNPVILRSTDDLTISAAVTNDGSSRIDLVDDDATADQTPPGLSTTALLTIDAGGSIGGAGEVRAFAVTPGQFTAGSWSPPAQQFGVWYDTFGVPVVGVNFKTGTDLTITKTDGVTTATPGGAVTYTITAANSGPANAPGAMVADTFPAALTCTWTCGGTGGGACTAAGAGNIADLVDLPAGGSVTYTASCTISAAASGSLVNTATVTAPAGVTDTASGNNSATDTDSLSAAPAADLSATKTVSGSFTPGGAITYLLVLGNTGTADQADNPGDELTDVLPASLTLVSASATSGHRDGERRTEHGHLERLDPGRRLGDPHHPRHRWRRGAGRDDGEQPGHLCLRRGSRRHQREHGRQRRSRRRRRRRSNHLRSGSPAFARGDPGAGRDRSAGLRRPAGRARRPAPSPSSIGKGPLRITRGRRIAEGRAVAVCLGHGRSRSPRQSRPGRSQAPPRRYRPR